MKINLNNKGFTFLEILLTLSFGFVFVFSIIVIPTTLIKDYKEFDKQMDYVLSVVKISKSLYEDISLENGEIGLTENQIILGDSDYIFTTEGFYRNHNTRILLTDLTLAHSVENKLLTLTLENGDNDINLKYKLDFSTFYNGDY